MKQFGFGVLVLLMAVNVACSSSAAPTVPPVITVVNLQTPVSPTVAPAPTNAPTQPTAVPTPYPTDPPPPTPKRIAFQQGQFNTTVQGVLAKNGMDKWILRINAGQTLNVNLVPTNGKAKLTIVGADGYPLITDHADAMQWSGQVNGAQDYTITIIAFEDTAPSYALQITVPPLQPAPVPPTVAPALKRISFAPNAISATVQGVLLVNGTDQWVLKVSAGQTMTVNLAPANGRARLVIYGADGNVLISDHADAMQWSGAIPSTQDYNIKVTAYDGTAPNYILQVTIPPR